MNASKVVGQRKTPRTPAEFYALGARLDHELSVVRAFERNVVSFFKARTWDELAQWESQRHIREHRWRHQ